jgi:peptidoglycan/LPS O-acetylase OafA/YrhL
LNADFYKGLKKYIIWIAMIVVIVIPSLIFLQVFIIPLFIIQLANIKFITNKTGYWGDFTYGVYVFSFPVQQLLIYLNVTQNNPYILFFCTLLIVLPLSIASWHLIEKKFLSMKDKIK